MDTASANLIPAGDLAAKRRNPFAGESPAYATQRFSMRMSRVCGVGGVM
jgi:hypothetical protein